ncbi:MAG: LON peptidase substrate-binding domain-containing protein, partial [Planctomycetota bacterium]
MTDEHPGVLPLFPLPSVLFPGMPFPLHIFEPRYRELLQ